MTGPSHQQDGRIGIVRRRLLGGVAATAASRALAGVPGLAAFATLAGGVAASRSTLAQTAWPTRPVRLVVPFPPGGATDIIGRLIAQRMSEVWKQQVVVENRPGAGTVIGTQAVAAAAPDGYTLGMAITAHVINPAVRANLPYDTVKDIAGVTQVAQAHLVLAAHPSFEANDVPGLIAAAKKKPGLGYATPGSGTAMHLTMEQLKLAAGIDLTHVPYKGGAPALQDVLAGNVPLFTDVLYSAAPHIKAGKLKVLAIMSPQRIKSAPDYPTIAETVPGVSSTSLIGVIAPRATPIDLLERISADIAREATQSELNAKLLELGSEPVGSRPAEYDRLIRTEIDKWRQVVGAAKISVD